MFYVYEAFEGFFPPDSIINSVENAKIERKSDYTFSAPNQTVKTALENLSNKIYEPRRRLFFGGVAALESWGGVCICICVCACVCALACL